MATSTLGSGTLVLAGTTSGTTTVTATAVAGTTTLTLPAATDTLVGRATTDTLTNKTLTSPTITGTLTTTGNTILGDASTDTLNVGNGDLVKDASGNLGIGTSSPNRTGFTAPVLSITNGTSGIVELIGTQASDGTVGQIAFYNTSSSVRIAQILVLRSGANNSGALTFQTNNAGTLGEVARFSATGALVFNGGTTTANGIGITFPATQSASSNANTLDDYEEGTWTLTLTGTGSISVGVNTTSRYTKIGNIVTVTSGFDWSSSTLTGTINIGGLPFAISNVTGSYRSAASFGYTSGVVFAGQLVSDGSAGATSFSWLYLRSGTTPTDVVLSSSGAGQICFTYQVA